VFIIFFHVLILYIFIAMVVDNFNLVKEQMIGYTELTKDQKEWADLQKFFQKRKIKRILPKREGKWQQIC
jgi:hypothetical protein